MKNNTKYEKLLNWITYFLVISVMLTFLTGCSGSCIECNFGHESDEGYNLVGVSLSTNDSCSSTSCKSASGCSDSFGNYEDSDTLFLSCTQSSESCLKSSNCYSGGFVSKDIGFGLSCGNENCENTFGCVEGCVGCAGDMDASSFFEFIYDLLGL